MNFLREHLAGINAAQSAALASLVERYGQPDRMNTHKPERAIWVDFDSAGENGLLCRIAASGEVVTHEVEDFFG